VKKDWEIWEILVQFGLINRPISTISADSPFGELKVFCALGWVGQAKLKFPLYLGTKIFPAFL
jgi:hypothetical protein